MSKPNCAAHPNIRSSTVFAYKSDRWLSALTLFLSTHHSRLSSITLSSLPSATRDYLSPFGHTDLDHLVDVAEWCLIIVAWGCGLRDVSYSVRTLDRISFALFLDHDHELGETLERWRVACEMYRIIIEECEQYVRTLNTNIREA